MSKYKWRDLARLKTKTDAHNSPLSVLCHIDVNCFYAQVEAVRCGYTKDDPVVCVQWNSIVAVSYAARKYGISRMDSIQQALKKTDKIIPIHTAVFKKGEDFWQYHDGWGPWVADRDKQLPSSDYKISLDPYRRESRKIFKIFTEYCDLAEKASVDEVFLDIARLCLQSLMFSEELIPGKKNHPTIQLLQETFKNGDFEEEAFLPPVPEELKELKFVGDVYNPNNLPLIEDWDDVLFALGSRISHELREEIHLNLGYTTSCGLARTKNICKLASNFKKPDAQTIIKNSCINTFLDNGKFEINSFWSMGGILGKELIQLLHLPQRGSIQFIRENWPTANDLRAFFERIAKESSAGRHSNSIIDFSRTDELADKIYDLVRGQYRLPVMPQTMVKSMMANKNMTGQACNSLVDCFSWLEVFAGELAGRVLELQQEYGKVIIPRTVHILVRTKAGESHSKSGPFIQPNTKIDSKDLLKVAAKLVASLDAKYGKGKEYAYYPLQNINMSISNLEVTSSKKSVIEMFGGQVQVREPARQQSNDKSPEVSACVNSTERPKCVSCDIEFENEIELQEHADYHVALRLSEKINGVNNDSKNLSLGERRLLAPKRSVSRQEAQTRKKRKSNKKEGSSSDIFKYFTKG